MKGNETKRKIKERKGKELTEGQGQSFVGRARQNRKEGCGPLKRRTVTFAVSAR